MTDVKLPPKCPETESRIDALETRVTKLVGTCEKTQEAVYDLQGSLMDLRDDLLDERSKRIKVAPTRYQAPTAVKVGGAVGVVGVITALAQAIPTIVEAIK